MNYLKKKLKSHKRGHDDPEDFDDYIPVAPPHPSEILRQQQEADRLKNATPEQLAAIEDKKQQEIDRLAAKEEAKKGSEGWQFFEQLTARVNDTVTKSEKVIEKLKDSTTAAELTRQADIELGFLDPVGPDEEDERGASFAKGQWVGFGESAGGQDNWAEEGTSVQETNQLRKASVVVAIEEPTDPTTVQNLLDDFGFGPPVTSDSDNNLAAPSIPVLYDSSNEAIEDDPFDTSYVNVSLVAKKSAEESIIASKKIRADLATQLANIEQFEIVQAPTFEPLPDLSPEQEPEIEPIRELTPEPEPEPEEVRQDFECEAEFTELSTSRRASEIGLTTASLVNPSNLDLDTGSVGVADDPIDVDIEDPELNDPAIASIYRHGHKVLSKFGSNTSLASILSNPFLNEGDTDLYASGMCTPYSGAATPNRRGSTNPFEDSPQDEAAGFAANEIAALTMDFCNAIGTPEEEEKQIVAPKPPRPVSPTRRPSASKPPPPRPDAPKSAPPKPKPPVPPPPPPPPSVSAPPPSPQPLEYEVHQASETLQQSLPKTAMAEPPPPTAAASIVTIADQEKEAELFDPFATIRDDHSDHSGSNRPSLSTDPDAAQSAVPGSYLDAPAIPDYPSDVSENEEDVETFADQVNDQVPEVGTERRRSSALQLELIDRDRQEPQPQFEPLPDPGTLSRKASVVAESDTNIEPVPENDSRRSSKASLNKPYFDPFERVQERDPLSPATPPETQPLESQADLPNEPSKPNYEYHEEEEANEEPVKPNYEYHEEEEDKPNEEPVKPNYDYHEDVDEESSTNIPVKPNYEYHEETEQEDSAPRDLSGIENVAYEDNSQDIEMQVSERQDYEATAATDTIAVDDTVAITTSSDTIAVIETTDTAGSGIEAATGGSDSGVGGIGFDDTDPGRDPFDTSDFSFEPVHDSVPYTDNAVFDAFSSRFDQTQDQAGISAPSAAFDAFSSPAHKIINANAGANVEADAGGGFDVFDPFSTAHIKPPKNTPVRVSKELSKDSFDDDDDEQESFKVVIKAKMREPAAGRSGLSIAPLLPPPPKTPTKSRELESYETRPDEFSSLLAAKRIAMAEPVKEVEQEEWQPPALGDSATATKRSDSIESPSTPLFDEDMSLPLEDFPAKYDGDGWEMYIRHPAKKKLTANRFWKKIFVRVSENSVVQLFNKKEDNDPFQELPLQPSYSMSEISAQQYDQYGKIFTLKLQYIFYRERVGVRKAQIAKVIQGQIQSVGQIAKLGMPLEHAPQISELLKLGTLNYDELKVFAQVVEEALFRQPLHRDRALTYKTEEIQIIMQDELYVEQSKTGTILKQLARVRLFFIAFINGMPSVEIGVNDMTRQGKEVVGRHDIIPVVTEEWIRIENYDFHSCVMLEEFEKLRILKLIPPDACYFELMRFRVRPPKNRELPLQVNTNLTITKTKVELKCEVLVPGCISRKHGQIPCEDISIRLHIPECWIYFFRTEKHLRYGSVKSANRRHGKIKVIIELVNYLSLSHYTHFFQILGPREATWCDN